jgi:hypothetical protein
MSRFIGEDVVNKVFILPFVGQHDTTMHMPTRMKDNDGAFFRTSDT